MTSTPDMQVDPDLHLAKAEARRVAQGVRSLAWDAWRRRGPSAAAGKLADHIALILAELTACTGQRAPSPLVASAYLPMRTELDPLGLLSALAEAGLTTALPVVAARDTPLQFRAWNPGDPTVTAGFGTREPPPDRSLVEPILLLVPLLAFDKRGYRLGYGGGYYDRTLRLLRLRGPVCAIGIAFDEQMIDAVPHLDYDERLNAVVTPSGLQRISA
jgi:5-formyltetrahydrofolate cyclo-ligase